MTTIVNSFKDIPRLALRADKQVDGKWLVYLPGDELPSIVYTPDKDAEDAEAAKSYSKLKALIDMSPAQVQTWVTANVTTLAQAQDAIKTLAIAVSILARKL